MKTIILSLFALCFATNFCVAQTTMAIGDTQQGLASYYANKFHGKKTASGEKFDMYAMTAAHPILPFNSIVKLTNVKNGKWVTVRINDRGPFNKRRILDMSKAAALKLDIIKAGAADIELEVLKIPNADGKEEAIASTNATQAKPAKKSVDVNKKSKKEKEKSVKSASKSETVAQKGNSKSAKKNTKKEATKATDTKVTSAKEKATKSAKETRPLNERFNEVKTYNIWGTVRQPKGFGVQLGSFNDIEKALQIGNEATNLGMKEVYIQTGWSQSVQVYRVLFSSAPSEEKANQLLPIVQSKGFPQAFVKAHY